MLTILHGGYSYKDLIYNCVRIFCVVLINGAGGSIVKREKINAVFKGYMLIPAIFIVLKNSGYFTQACPLHSFSDEQLIKP
jgi:hypothetical protein